MFIFAIILCAIALASDITNTLSRISIYEERIPNTEYSIYVNQTLTLTYDALAYFIKIILIVTKECMP